MLLNISLSNILCFETEITFSMVASSDDKHPNHLVEKGRGKHLQTLRASAIYGANAHGKTRFVEAIAFFKELVVRGTKPLQKIAVKPFRLNPECRNKNSQFEINFHFKGIDYNCGIALSSESIWEEWLFVREKTKEVPFFERKTEADGTVRVELGSSLRRRNPEGFLQYVAQGTRHNQPFFTEAVDRNVKGLEGAYEWFSEVLIVVSASAQYGALPTRARTDREFISFISGFLKTANTGIEGVLVDESPLDFDKLPISFPEGTRAEILERCKSGKAFSVIGDEGEGFVICNGENEQPVVLVLKTLHKDTEGNNVTFDLEDESSGTHRLIHFLPILSDLGGGDRVFIIDELDRKLHPLLSYSFVDYFLNAPGQRQSNSQLIFTTHNTHLLDLSLLRRDEIWFVEKKADGSSDLYSLANLKIRPDLDIEKGYLKGRFGAIPFVGNLRELGWIVSPANELAHGTHKP